MSDCTLLLGDVREVLRGLPDGSVHCVVTSPPYWGLRDYGTGTWEGGDPNCKHVASPRSTKVFHNSEFNQNRPSREETKTGGYYAPTCPKCGAVRVDRQIGLEQTPEEYVASLVAVFREVRRVLREDGTVWLNLGDSYMSQPSWGRDNQTASLEGRKHSEVPYALKDQMGRHERGRHETIKPKDLVGIPWRVAFALQDDGWYLRSDIIWAKTNPMPESVTDRPTKSHEYLFLLAKSERYFYDSVAIKEPLAPTTMPRMLRGVSEKHKNINGAPGQTPHSMSRPRAHGEGYDAVDPSGRNRRTVWTIATKPYKGAHFATYPADLVRPCILAGTSSRGVCPECGAPWVRVLERGLTAHDGQTDSAYEKGSTANRLALLRQAARERGGEYVNVRRTIGWKPTCRHEAEPVAPVVLDPFNGAATTGLVALELGRSYIGIDLNPEYLQMSRKRLAQVSSGMLMGV